MNIRLPTVDESIQRAATLYDCAAVYCIADKRGSGDLLNVYTAVIRGSSARISSVPHVPEIIETRGRVRKRTFILYRCLVDFQEAYALVNATRSNIALLPRGPHVRYANMEPTEAFLPEHESDHWMKSPLSKAAWSKRLWSTNKTLNNVALTDGTARQVFDLLPEAVPTRFAVLDIHARLDALGDVEDLYPIGLTLQPRSSSEGIYLHLDGDTAWQAAFPDTVVNGIVGRSLLRRASFSVPVTLSGDSLVEGANLDESMLTLSDRGALLGHWEGFYIRAVGLNLSIVERRVQIQMDATGATVDVNVARDAEGQRTIVGDAAHDNSYVQHWNLGRRWARDVARPFEEIVLDQSDPRPRSEVYADLVALVKGIAASEPVRLVDPYVIDRAALTRIALVAAATPASTLEILTIERTTNTFSIPDFENAVKDIAKSIRVRIRVIKPGISIHDRFLWLGDRIWHFGHSFNAYGLDDLSVISELRNVGAISRLKEILEPEFARTPIIDVP